MRADCAQGEVEKEPIPDLFGQYDLIDIINALLKSGRINENPLRSDLQGLTSIPFKRKGESMPKEWHFFTNGQLLVIGTLEPHFYLCM